MEFSKILENKEKVFNRFGKNVAIDSVMVKDNNSYFQHFYKPDGLHEMRSLSKVLVALAYGVVIDRGLISLNDYVYPVIEPIINLTNNQNLEIIKQWQIKHLLTYTAGYESQMFSERFITDIKPTDYLNYVVNYDLVRPAGEKYVYNNAETFLLSVYFQEKLGVNLTEFVKSEIFKPLEITNFVWDNYDKYCPGGTGLYVSHNDLFKIGELILNKGKFNNKQIVSPTYIEEMCKAQLETPYAYNAERVLPKSGVGFVMHISRDGYFYKDGKNGQYLIINFNKKQIISILSSETDMSCVTEILRGII